jgi:hypothetical protein
MKRIDELFAFVAEDAEGEGIIGITVDGVFFPLVGADMDRIDSLMPIAKQIGETYNKSVKLLRFSKRSLMEEFDIE